MPKVLKYIGLSESTYHYKNSDKKRGAKASSYTLHVSKGLVLEEVVINSIKSFLSHEFIDCGYHTMTAYLRRDGYQINHKKVYRIMKEAGLLQLKSRISRNAHGKKYVRFRKVITKAPLDCLEMDIKLVWIPSTGKNAYLFSIIDVHTRRILGYKFDNKMKQEAVIELLSEIIDQYGTSQSMIIRSDNGSQFIANKVQEYIGMVGIDQEFTHVATPEENAHIESYHGTLKRDIFDKTEYHSFGEIEAIIKRYVEFYNNIRIHGLLGKITPIEKWQRDKHMIQRFEESA